jgi:hypothetical protein
MLTVADEFAPSAATETLLSVTANDSVGSAVTVQNRHHNRNRHIAGERDGEAFHVATFVRARARSKASLPRRVRM